MPVLDERIEAILRAIVTEYTRTALPVASRTVAETSESSLSPASVRTIMAFLEHEGFLTAPHTSSGRVPTASAYAYLISRGALQNPRVNVSIRVGLAPEGQRHPQKLAMHVGRALSETIDETVLVASLDGWHELFGFSRVFQKPDFQDTQTLRNLSASFDDPEMTTRRLAHVVEGDVAVLVGDQSPFGVLVSTVVARASVPRRGDLFFGIVGPLRMQYGRNIALLHEARRAFHTLLHS